MKTKSRPQYYRIRRVLEMVREGTQSGYLTNSSDFKEELGVSRRTVARDMDFLRDEENAPIEYDESRKIRGKAVKEYKFKGLTLIPLD